MKQLVAFSLILTVVNFCGTSKLRADPPTSAPDCPRWDAYLHYRKAQGILDDEWLKALRVELPLKPAGAKNDGDSTATRSITPQMRKHLVGFLVQYGVLDKPEDLEGWVRANEGLVKRIEELGPPSGALPIRKEGDPDDDYHKGGLGPFSVSYYPDLTTVAVVMRLVLAHGMLSTDPAVRRKDFTAVDRIIAITKAGHSVSEIIVAARMEYYAKWCCLLISYSEFGADPHYAAWIESQGPVVTLQDIATSIDEEQRRRVLYYAASVANSMAVASRRLTESEISELDAQYKKIVRAIRKMNGWSDVARYRSQMGDTFTERILSDSLSESEAVPGRMLYLAFRGRDIRELTQTLFAKGPKAALRLPLSEIKLRPLPSDPEAIEVIKGFTKVQLRAPEAKDRKQNKPKQ